MSKPKEFWIIESTITKPSIICNSPNGIWDDRKPIHVIEKSAYDKVVKALKEYEYEATYDGGDMARETLKELGEGSNE